MGKVTVLAFLVAIMLGGGVLTASIFGSAPLIVQSDIPDANVFEATPEQATLFAFWILFVIFNLVGAGLTLAVLFWRGNYEVKLARSSAGTGTASESTELAETASE